MCQKESATSEITSALFATQIFVFSDATTNTTSLVELCFGILEQVTLYTSCWEN